VSRNTNEPDLSLAFCGYLGLNQVLADSFGPVRTVQIPDVDVVSPKRFEATFQLLKRFTLRACFDFGGEDNLFPATSKTSSQHRFIIAPLVDWGSVEMIDAKVKASCEDAGIGSPGTTESEDCNF
jgi:hypothetical protein